MLSKEWSKFKSGSDIRGVALEGVKDMPIDLTDEIVERMAAGFGVWLVKKLDKPAKKLTRAERMKLIEELTKEMKNAARLLEFEHAASLRDRIQKLRDMK